RSRVQAALCRDDRPLPARRGALRRSDAGAVGGARRPDAHARVVGRHPLPSGSGARGCRPRGRGAGRVRARVRGAGELPAGRAEGPSAGQELGGRLMSGPAPAPGSRRVDLHAHTAFSDGVLSPEALVARATDKRLAALAVTDHDTVEAIPRARAAAGSTLELVPGIEMSTAFEGADLHVLGFYINPDHGPLRERMVRFQEERRER